MKRLLTLLTLSTSFHSIANQCPVGYERENYNLEISSLNKEHMIIINNDQPIVGDGTFQGTSLFTKNGLMRINYKEKLSSEISIEARAQIKINSTLKTWDSHICGLLGGQCLLVDHPYIQSIQIDSKDDKKLKDLRLAGILVCKETGSSLANRNVVDSDRSVAGRKSEYEPNYKSPTTQKKASIQ